MVKEHHFLWEGVEYCYADIVDLTWANRCAVNTFDDTPTLILTMDDGTVLNIVRAKLSEEAKGMMEEVWCPC